MAVRALSHLAGDPDRLGRFLAVSGIGPQSVREAAASPGFLAGVLEHLLSDEVLLLGFAAEAGLAPDDVGRAHRLLAVRGAPSD